MFLTTFWFFEPHYWPRAAQFLIYLHFISKIILVLFPLHQITISISNGVLFRCFSKCPKLKQGRGARGKSTIIQKVENDGKTVFLGLLWQDLSAPNKTDRSPTPDNWKTITSSGSGQFYSTGDKSCHFSRDPSIQVNLCLHGLPSLEIAKGFLDLLIFCWSRNLQVTFETRFRGTIGHKMYNTTEVVITWGNGDLWPAPQKHDSMKFSGVVYKIIKGGWCIRIMLWG